MRERGMSLLAACAPPLSHEAMPVCRRVALTVLALLVVGTPTVSARAGEGMAAGSCVPTPTGGPTVRSPYARGPAEGAMQAAWTETELPGDNPWSYLIHIPDGVPAGPVPLVVTVHGLLGNAKQHLTQTRWVEVADRHGFVIVAPNGRRSWDNSQGSADVDFIRDVIADVRARDCIDDRRIYLTGHSNGGFMTHRFACDAGDIVAAAASYAAGDVDAFPHESPCPANGLDGAGTPVPGFAPVPIGMWHGDDDAIVSYRGGRRGLRGWLERHDCDTTAAVAEAPFGSRETFGSCTRGEFDVVFRTLAGHGHAWPDGCGGQRSTGGSVACEPEAGTGPWPQATDLTEELWTFLSTHERAMPAVAQGEPAPGPPPGPQVDDVPAWADDGIGSGIDSEATFRRDVPLAADDEGLDVALVLRVQTGGDGAGIGPSHPVCPTANPGPSTQSMAGRTAWVSAVDVSGVAHEVEVATEPFVVTMPDGTVEHLEAVHAHLDGVFDPAATVVRAWADGDALGFWWACGRPAAFFKETFAPAHPACVHAATEARACSRASHRSSAGF